MNLTWFLRMARWARRPPPMSRVKLVVAIIALCIALAAIERIWGWPDLLTTVGGSRPVR